MVSGQAGESAVGTTKTRRQRELALRRAARQTERRMAAQRRRRRILTGVAAGLVVVVGAGVVTLILVSGGGGSSTVTASPATPTPTAAPTPTTTPIKAGTTSKVGSCTYTSTGEAPSRQVGLPAAAGSVSTQPATMTIVTSLGTMKASLDAAAAPCTVHALLSLADAKFFDKTPCHRETTDGIFVLQCGDPTGSGTGGPGYRYNNENTANVNYNRGVIAMANSGADTNGSQFFINYKDPAASGAQALAGHYTVIGKITEGLDVLDKITAKGVQGGGQDGAPVTKPVITSLTITQS
jgi:peptidyl-prolyl cis-trans isomerase B (cyclophilin B)